MAYKKKQTDTTTFYTCIKCKNPLLQSTVIMGINNGLAVDNIECNKCKLKIKKTVIVTDLSKDFVLETIPFTMHGFQYTVTVWADENLCPYYVIEDKDKCVLYITDQEQTPEGIEVFNYLCRKEIIKPRKLNEQ